MDAIPAYVTGLVAVLLLTSFLKIFTSLNILRYGLGLQAGGFGLVVAGLSLALTLVVMSPRLGPSGGLEILLGKPTEDAALQEKLKPFIEQHAHKDITARFERIAEKLSAPATVAASSSASMSALPAPLDATAKGHTASVRATSSPVVVASFVVSQLQEAFYVGLLLLVPFVVLDLVVANMLMALGITQMPQAVVALPLKLLVFFAVDGWQLVSEKLLNGYL